ncbi:MAG: hypothetical protein KO318_11075 [Methanobacterium sp.]|jgi:hypothetical protein|nr:hypothetical protein [Methanobacterium sp.]
MLKKERNHDKSEEYRYKALKLDPGLKKSKENGKMILSIKGMKIKKV